MTATTPTNTPGRQKMTPTPIELYVQELVSNAPPLNTERIARIRELLNSHN